VPAVTIEVRRRYSPEEETGIIDAVHAGLIESLKIPDWDKTIRLIAHEPHRFAVQPGKGERFTLVTIDMFAGRSLGAKKSLYQAVVRNLAAFGIPADHIKILLREIPAENWGIRGGIPASEVDLNFEIKV